MNLLLINSVCLDGTPITINVSKIVCYEPRFTSLKTSPDEVIPYTYIVLSGGQTVTRSIRDTYEQFSKKLQFCSVILNNDDGEK